MATKKPTKVPKLDAGEDEGVPEGITESQQQALEKIVSIQREIDQLNERASEEILHVEQKYNKLRTPHFKKRSDLIKELPDFWPTTLMNNAQFAELLSEEDETALQYLENVTVEEYEDVRSGYTITFYFKTNPYFTNDSLSKEYTLETTGETTVLGTEINWKEGADLTNRSEPVPEDGESRKRPLEEVPSFFCWFSETESADDAAELIKDDIWPNPLQYYFGSDEGPGQLEVSVDEDLEYDEDEEDDEEADGLDEDDSDAGDEVVLSDEDDIDDV